MLRESQEPREMPERLASQERTRRDQRDLTVMLVTRASQERRERRVLQDHQDSQAKREPALTAQRHVCPQATRFAERRCEQKTVQYALVNW